MKKTLSVLLLLTLAISCLLVGCQNPPGQNPNNTTGATTTAGVTTGNPEDQNPPASNAMTYAQYVAAELESEVIIEAYVQAKQSWWENKATFYTADQDGAYFIYEMACTEEQYNQLVPGTKIRVTGYKSAWAGEIEIIDATFEILEGTYIAPAKDLTDKLGTNELINYQNQLATFRGMTVVSVSYKNDEPGDDIYVTLSYNGAEYEFCVERYLTGPETDVYKAVGELQVGDVIDVTGFVYWYENVNTHITAIGTKLEKDPSAMTYAEYAAAAIDAEVIIDTYVQAKQSWWENKATFYTADQDGAYFIYDMACTEEQYNQLVPGTRILVTGYKAEWSGEVEIMDATFEILEGTYIAPAKDLTNKLGTEELINFQNQLAIFKGMTVVSISYKNDEPGDDIYVTLSYNGENYDFCVERYLTAPETDLYKAVGEWKVGDVIDVTGFVYWYEGVNPHITSFTLVIPAKDETAMTYAEYVAAELESEVIIEAYVQAKQSWWENKATFYTADQDGAYFIYDMACTEEEYNQLVPGTRILVTGYKAEWSGEVEIMDATFEILEGSYIAPAKDLTDKLGTEELINYQNQLAIFTEMTVVSISYKNDEPGDDIYVTLSHNGENYDFCVERYLTAPDTDVYKTVSELKAGDVITVEGFVYWYENVNTHITNVTLAK